MFSNIPTALIFASKHTYLHNCHKIKFNIA